MSLKKQSYNYLFIILNVQKKSYAINKQWMGQKMISVVADWSEQVAEGGESCLSHCFWMVGESG